jgi:hypothetical protein
VLEQWIEGLVVDNKIESSAHVDYLASLNLIWDTSRYQTRVRISISENGSMPWVLSAPHDTQHRFFKAYPQVVPSVLSSAHDMSKSSEKSQRSMIPMCRFPGHSRRV